MKTILIAALSLLPVAPTQSPLPQEPKLAMICFKTGERQSGMNKICYYDCLGSEAAITVSSTELCPLSINN